MADIFREVNDELKRDRASELARKYGPYFIGFAVAIVLGTLGYNLWRDWDLERRSERSDQFNAALELASDGQNDAAVAALAELGEPDGAYGTLAGVARLFFVMHQIDDGDPAELREMLQPLFVAGNGFRPLAMELNAVLSLREGDRDEARRIYTEIADDLTAPPGLRARAAQVLASLAEGRPQ